MFKSEFIEYLNDIGLKEATIRNYTDRIENNEDVQNILCRFSGNKNLFGISDVAILLDAHKYLKTTDLDKIGHRMYSCGIKHYINFISKNKDLILKQEIIKVLI